MIGPFRPELGPPQVAADGDTCTDCQRSIPAGTPVRADGRGQLVHDVPCGSGLAVSPTGSAELRDALQTWRATLGGATAALNALAAVPPDEVCRAGLAIAAEHARAAASLLTTLEDTFAPDRGVAEQQLLTAHLRDLVRREQQCLAASVMTATPNGGPAAMRASPGRRE